MPLQPTGYWTFFCNPDKWEIDGFLETNPREDIYQVNTAHKDYFKAGQQGVIRVGVDSRTKAKLQGRQKLKPGIYAIVTITSNAIPRRAIPDKHWDLSKWTEKELSKPIVNIRITKNLLNNPILLSDILSTNIAVDNYLIKGFQASTMPLQKETFHDICQLADEDNLQYIELTNESIANHQDIVRLEEKYRYASPKVYEVLSKKIERGAISDEVKKAYQYKCKVCEAIGNNPVSFRKNDGFFYIETHHINPVSNLESGSLGLANLITLCANHHRQFHYGDVKIVDNNTQYLKVKIDGIVIKIEKVLL